MCTLLRHPTIASCGVLLVHFNSLSFLLPTPYILGTGERQGQFGCWILGLRTGGMPFMNGHITVLIFSPMGGRSVGCNKFWPASTNISYHIVTGRFQWSSGSITCNILWHDRPGRSCDLGIYAIHNTVVRQIWAVMWLLETVIPVWAKNRHRESNHVLETSGKIVTE